MMVGTKRAEEVVDPYLEVKPTTRALKRALLVSLRCVDPDSDKRPKMSQVVRMLEADEYPLREVPNQCSSWNDFFCLFVWISSFGFEVFSEVLEMRICFQC
jgi:hypothetical protein